MNLLARPWLVQVRNRVRKSDVARALYRRWMSAHDYEERFSSELIKAVGPTSVVWDVGANVGLYTEKFLARGARLVVCVEPSPAAVAALRQKFQSDAPTTPRVRIMPVALSNTPGIARLFVDGASPTNQLRSMNDADPSLIDVKVVRADELRSSEDLPLPTVLKVDVEGYELEALQGFGHILNSTELRAIFIEVHFALLHERGLDAAPKLIEQLLKDSGFTVRWLDLSHVCGIRS